MRLLLLSLACLCLYAACSERVDINAPSKDIYVVYGVLDPQSDRQTIRVSKAFQTQENAYKVTAQEDLSVKGLEVVIKGNGRTYAATQVDSVAKDTLGDFFPYTTVYQFDTDTDQALLPGLRYVLEIRDPADSNLFLTAQTRIPPQPLLVSPGVSGQWPEYCLNDLSIEDSVRISFFRSRGSTPTRARAFEIRFIFQYTEDGLPQTYRFGPTKLFDESVACGGVGDDLLCHSFRRGVILDNLRATLRDLSKSYRYQVEPLCGRRYELSQAFEVQVTALDTALATYIDANDPRYLNLNTYRREFTNLEGTVNAVGIFGAISYHNLPVSLSPCAEYRLQLNPAVDDSACQ